MKNLSTWISIILILLFVGIFISNKYTKNQYMNKLNEIKREKDSLDVQVKNIEAQLKIRDSLLVQSIVQSREIIKEIENRISISEKVYNAYEANSQAIINDLIQLSNE